MVSPRIKQLLNEELSKLPEPLQERVLAYARALRAERPQGTPVEEIMKFAGTIAPDDLREIAGIIERDCEQVDPDGW